jgi:hypothetical protein
MQTWSQTKAMARILPVVQECGIKWYEQPATRINGSVAYLTKDKNGLRLTPHKNTWKRKRETGAIIRIEYFIEGSSVMIHVEPWINYPSDHLIAKLMLLPRGVK